MPLGRFARYWAGIVVLPFAAGETWGLWAEADIRVMTIFRIMGQIAPLWLWGVGWALVAAGAAWSAFIGTRPEIYRWTTIVAAALATGQFAATMYTRLIVGNVLTTVGIAWAYLPAAVFTASLVALAFPHLIRGTDER